ncbi:Uncharacterized protein SCF082_LOCUS9454, partial [Durusdinium trenchii]
MKSARVYVAQGNLFWLNVRQLTSPSVPINAASLVKMQKAFFERGPEKLSLEVVCGVSSFVDAKRFESMKGALQRISPEEIDHALILHVAQRINDGASEEELLAWRNVFLTVSLRCEVIETKEEAFFRALTFRQRSDLAELWSKKTQDLGPEDDCPKSAFEFVDSAMKIHERMLSNENAFDVIFCLEERFGKLSCFQHMSVLEAVCMKTKKIDEMLWILHSIEDMLMRGEVSNKAFTNRTLKGGRTGGGTRGLLDEFLAKKGLLKYLAEESQNWGRKRQLPKFQEGADLSWMGSLTEAERLLIHMIKNVVYRNGHDGQLRTSLKTSTLPADIVCHEPFNKMIEVIKEEIDKMRRAQKQGVEGEESQGAGDKTGIFVHELLPDLSLSVDEDDDETAQKLISYAKEAEQLVDQFVRLVVEQDSMQGMGQILESCASMSNDQRAILVYDTKVAGEATAQPHVRRPQFRKDHFQKIASAFTRGRGGPQPRSEDAVCVLDGGRQLSSLVLGACVKFFGDEQGQHWEKKQRQEAMVHYDEQSVRSRKCLVLPYDQEQGCWIVSKEEKDKIYGTAGKVLAGGALPDCPDRPDLGADRFPVNYHTMPQGFFAELFHSLAASLMVNGTEIDGKGAEAAILAKKSYIGICFTDFHAIELRKLLVRFVWEHFQDQSSAYYK